MHITKLKLLLTVRTPLATEKFKSMLAKGGQRKGGTEMVEIHEITDREKELLNALGTFPEISMKELLACTPYKRVSSISKKLDEAREQRILRGPVYDVDHNKLCKNTLHRLFCIFETQKRYKTVISYLKLIEPLSWVHLVLSPHKKVLNAGFLSSDDAEMISLFQLLKNHHIISDYIVRAHPHRRIVENPNFFGDDNPLLDNLLTPCELPDASLPQYDTEWNECDIALLPYLEVGYKGGKLIEVLKAERKLQKLWTYNQIKCSREKMVTHRLLRKTYVIFPFLPQQCAVFILFFRTEDITLTRRILHNFAKGSRMYRHYVHCEDWGALTCFCYPLFLTGLMSKLDRIDEITAKELYQLRSLSGASPIALPSHLEYFDFDKQTLEYPHHVYREKIKENLDESN